MKKIRLYSGELALVDDENFQYLNQFKWSKKVSGNVSYAVRAEWNNISKKTKTIKMHQDILQTSGNLIDHINHNGLDNRKSNLRFCNHQQNARNGRKHKDNTTGYKGVYFKKDLKSNPYYAQIRVGTKRIFLGYFSNKHDAAKAYNQAASKHFGEFVNLNILDKAT